MRKQFDINDRDCEFRKLGQISFNPEGAWGDPTAVEYTYGEICKLTGTYCISDTKSGCERYQTHTESLLNEEGE
jgi:hypothetical protein